MDKGFTVGRKKAAKGCGQRPKSSVFLALVEDWVGELAAW